MFEEKSPESGSCVIDQWRTCDMTSLHRSALWIWSLCGPWSNMECCLHSTGSLRIWMKFSPGLWHHRWITQVCDLWISHQTNLGCLLLHFSENFMHLQPKVGKLSNDVIKSLFVPFGSAFLCFLFWQTVFPYVVANTVPSRFRIMS